MYPGTDILEVARLSKALAKHPRLKTKLFTEAEIVECEAKCTPTVSYAGRYAAKEAVLKALGTGFRYVKWHDLEIVKDLLGKPVVKLYGAAKQIALDKNIIEVRVSISHTRELALAFAIAVSGEEQG